LVGDFSERRPSITTQFRAKTKKKLKMTKTFDKMTATEVFKEAARTALELQLENASSVEAVQDVLSRITPTDSEAQPEEVDRRRSPRIQPKPHAEPEEEAEGPEDEAEETDDEGEFLSLPPGPRQARVQKLRELLHPAAKVGSKRKHRAFNEVRWEEIEAAYMVKNKRLPFNSTRVPLPPAKLRAFRGHVDVVVSTSPPDVNLWTKDNVKELAKDVFRYTGFSFDSVTLEVDSEVDMKNKELGVNGRADVVISQNKEHVVVVECKRGSLYYSKGMAQTMLAAETLLAKKIKDDSPDTCIYGLLTGATSWTWMRLDATEGRFFGTFIDPENATDSAEAMASIAYGILLGKPITET
jgi:hypothetical protein